MKKIFLDTNIILDILQRRGVFFLPASNLFSLGMQGKYIMYISPLTFVNCIYILRKYCGYEQALNYMKVIKKYVLLTNMREEELNLAIDTKGKDIEDMLQYYSAVNVGCEVVVTRNKKDFPQSGIPIMTAEELLNNY